MLIYILTKSTNFLCRYFDYRYLPEAETLDNATLTFEEATVKLHDLFLENLRAKLNPEREFGFLLSGGLDSSLVCAASANILSPVRIIPNN